MKKVILFVTLGLIGFGITMTVYMKSRNPQSTDPKQKWARSNPGKGVGTPSIGGDFELSDPHGNTYRSDDFRGKYMFIYFGYSYCPDICPIGLNGMTQTLKLMKSDAQHFQPIFITVDPERDTQDQLKSYMQNFHPRFLGLTGSPEAIKNVIKAYRVYAVKAQPDGTSADYLVDHSSIIYVMNRKGQFIAHFNHATEPELMTKTLRQILSQEKKH